MALNKNGMDLKAIAKDQKAIDKLPNKGRAKMKKMASKMGKKEVNKFKIVRKPGYKYSLEENKSGKPTKGVEKQGY